MKLHEVIAVIGEQSIVGHQDDTKALPLSPLVIGEIVRRTIKAVGLDVAPDGEVYNPAPDPAKGWEAPRMARVRRRR